MNARRSRARLAPVTTSVVAIVGATATGKSALAMRLAAALDGEIVNADALQVYRGFDLGTAKPSRADRNRIPHHLIDILEPGETYSAGEFARRADLSVREIRERGRRAILVGGSGLYLKALRAGIAAIPPVDAGVRDELESWRAKSGLAALRAELARVDPATAARLAAGDTQRTLRALEVFRATGVPLSRWIASQPFGSAPPVRIERIIGLTLPRAVLYDRITSRARAMLGAGWLEEVRSLLDAGVVPSAPAFQAIGYRHLAEVVAGRATLEEATSALIRATRQFAKRQETWFRRESDIEWWDADSLERELPSIVEMIGAPAAGG